MTGHQSRIDTHEFRRKLQRETLKSQCFLIWGFLEKSLKGRIPPKWSVVAQAAPKLIIGGLFCLPKWNKIQSEFGGGGGNLEIPKFAKMRTNKSSRLVWLKSSQLEWRAVWWRKGFPEIHGSSMDIHGSPIHNPWIPIDHQWIIHGLSMDYPCIIHG